MRVGILGTNWGLMHVGAFRAAGAEVVAICGRDAEKTRAIAAREGIPHSMTDPAELVEASGIVVVASPDARHREHAFLAIRAGRHALVEKPLTITAPDAAELERFVATRPVAQATAVSFPYRFLPPFVALRGWLASRSPARELHVSVRNGFATGDAGGEEGSIVGASGDFGGVSHVVDAALWLLGAEPQWVQASLRGRPAQSVGLLVGVSTGALLTVSHRPAAEPGIEGLWAVRGDGWEAGIAGGYEPSLGGWRIGPARAFEAGTWSDIAPRCEPVAGAREPWAEAHVGIARAFLSAAAGGARGSLASIAEGARVQYVLDAAVRSELDGRRVTLGVGVSL